MRARTNISVKERRQLTLSEFRGVDFSKSPLHVSGNRATDSINFIGENGRNKKRNGWVQIANHLPKEGDIRPAINGMFPYKNGNIEEALVHAGTRFYRIKKSDRADPEYEWESVTVPTNVSITDTRSQAFASNGYLFIIGCGAYLKYVLDEKTLHTIDPYVPTTTIDINHNEMTEGIRKSHDLVNLLTGWRKNKLVGAGSEKTWQLDAKNISVKYPVKVTAVERTGSAPNYTYKEVTYEFDSNGQIEESNAIGIFDHTNGTVKLNFDTTPKIEGDNNITVEFYVESENQSTVERVVADSQFGVLFGIGGNADRLFVAGNTNTPNVVYFSEIDNLEYFPDQYTATFGTSGQPITALLRLSDNTLAVFKEYSEREPSVYYQSGEYRTTYDEDGNIERITPVFQITAGATLESAINPWTCGSFAGDNLILSKNGVFAIELTENVSTDVRTARERSLAINARLKAHTELKEAVGVSYKGKYYIAVDGCCYVADSLYKYTTNESQWTQYEWWYWENIPARVFAVVNDELWFGTEDGALCKFGVGYSDSKFVESKAGELTYNGDDAISYSLASETLKNHLSNDCAFKILTEDVYAVYLDSKNIKIFEDGSSHDRIFVSVKKENGAEDEDAAALLMKEIYEGAIVYIDHPNNHAENAIEYIVSDVNRANNSFGLKHGNTYIEIPRDDSFRLLWKVSGLDLFAKIDGDVVKLKKYKGDEDTITLTKYDTNSVKESYATQSFIAQLRTLVPVQAYWLTPVFDMGTNVNSKTLLKLTVSTDNDSYGRLRFGYETRANAREFSTVKNKPFSFEDFDFNAFAFETGFWSSYTVKVKEQNFNYIRFWFLSDSDSNCSINDLTATYKINARNLGVR
ncbi:MAG: hypothetical protein J6S14_12760 [Clostridia bacterium]|nr:hypothetical protein [Clostridia bacterium]